MPFPENWRLPLGQVVDSVMNHLVSRYGSAFDRLSEAILWALVQLEHFFTWLPWWAVVGLAAVATWRLSRRPLAGVGAAALLTMIGTFGLWDLAMRTLALVGVSVCLALLIGIPTGIALAASDRLRAVVTPLLDAMQTMPSFVYLIPAIMFFGLGKVPGVMATVIYALPPIIRLTDLGLRQVSAQVVEAADAFGATPWQTLLTVKLPLAWPSIMAGVNQTTMMGLSMVVIASMIGARGLGEQVLLAIQRIEIGRGFEAGLSIVALAIVIDRLTQALARRQQPGAGQAATQPARRRARAPLPAQAA